MGVLFTRLLIVIPKKTPPSPEANGGELGKNGPAEPGRLHLKHCVKPELLSRGEAQERSNGTL